MIFYSGGMGRDLSRIVLLVVFVCAVACSALGQCAPEWQRGFGPPGVNSTVYAAVAWDPDGAGPLPKWVVVGGDFTYAGGDYVGYIAAWDGRRWVSLGGGMNGAVRALQVLPGGDLVAGGNFTEAGGAPANRAARWDGGAWVPLGSGLNGAVFDMAVTPSGDLIACGGFTLAGGQTANHIARWNGSAWSTFGGGFSANNAYAVAVLANGDVVVGGNFTSVTDASGSVAALRIARWNGVGWSAMGSGLHIVYDLIRRANGDLIAVGQVPTAGGPGRVSRWNGVSWSAIAPDTDAGIQSVVELPNGNLVVGGGFTMAGAVQAEFAAAWDGASWEPLGGVPVSDVNALVALPNGELVVGGEFTFSGDIRASRVARWDGASWSAFGAGLDGDVYALEHLPDGRLVAGGVFEFAGGVPVGEPRGSLADGGVGEWDGVRWSPWGTGVSNGPNYYGTVRALAAMPNGDVVVGGLFEYAGGLPARRVARWDGVSWSDLAGGIPGNGNQVYSLLVMPDGSLLVGGNLDGAGSVLSRGVVRWDGVSWSSLNGGIYNSNVYALELSAGGEALVGGGFTSVDGIMTRGIAVWDGLAWSPLGGGGGVTGGQSVVRAIITRPDGSVVIGGNFAAVDGVAASNIARWDGVSWSALAGGTSGAVLSLENLPNGDLVAAGEFFYANGVAVSGMARWDGASWSDLGSGASADVRALSMGEDGLLYAGGSFQAVDGLASAQIARLDSQCVALAEDLGGSCASSGGANELLAEALPWTGGLFRARATGLPSLAIVAVVTGFATTALPLDAVFAEGKPGCVLRATPDLLDLTLAFGGELQSSFEVPNDPALAGAQLSHQCVPIELDASLQFTSITATNALLLTIGAF